MIRHVEIPWSKINGFISTYLRAHGIDDAKEMSTWCKWENDLLTLIFEQEEEAQRLPQTLEKEKLDEALTRRPAYLDRKPAS